MKIKMNKTNEDLTINAIMEKYKRHMTISNFSESSIDLVRRCYKDFCEYLSNEDMLMKDMDIEVINEYILWLKKKNNKDSTINIKLSNLRMFFYWSMNNNYLKEFKINLVKEEKVIKPTYSESQLEILLRKPNLKKCTFSEYRNWVTINFLLATGVRCNTIINIKIGEIDFENSLIILTTMKNKKQQLVPMSLNLYDILKEYLTYREGNEDDYLFCNPEGKHLTRIAFKDSMIQYNKKRGVEITSIHAYRHTYAKMFIKNGGDAFRLQRLLGHSSMEMTRWYVNLYAEDLQADYEKYNPLDTFVKSHTKQYIKM